MTGFSRGVFAVLLACGLGTALPAHADMQTLRSADNEIWGSVGGNFLNYKEPAPAPNLPDSEHGTLPSIAMGVSMLAAQGKGLGSNFYLSIDGSGSFGDARYNGAYFYYPTQPLQGTTSEEIWTVDTKLGRALPIGQNVLLIPYGDFGYRFWDRSLSADQDEQYQNFDLMAGVMVQVSPIKRLELTGYGAAGTTFSANMQTGGYDYPLGSAGEYKFGAKAGFAIIPQLELFTTLDFDHFHYVQSGVVDGAYEPSSFTNDTVWRVGLGYEYR
jgi:hypothetical protein